MKAPIFGLFILIMSCLLHAQQVVQLYNGVVPVDAPPMFYACAADNEFVAIQAVKLFTAWKSAGKSIEFHVYSKGGHGFGMRKQGLPIDNWNEQFKEWLKTQGF